MNLWKVTRDVSKYSECLLHLGPGSSIFLFPLKLSLDTLFSLSSSCHLLGKLKRQYAVGSTLLWVSMWVLLFVNTQGLDKRFAVGLALAHQWPWVYIKRRQSISWAAEEPGVVLSLEKDTFPNISQLSHEGWQKNSPSPQESSKITWRTW